MKSGKLLSLGIQHVLAMYAGAVIVPLIVGGAIGLTQSELAYLVSVDIFMCGIATLLQIWKNKFFGIGLPVVLGCTFTAVGPMIAIGKSYGISSIYGSILVAGIVVLLISKYFGGLIAFFPSVVTGSVVTIIGITLIPVAINDMAGGQGSKDFGSVDNLILAFSVLAIILLINRFFNGFTRAISILLGIIMGTIIAFFMGMVDFSPLDTASWFSTVRPFYFAMPTFQFSSIITMVLVAIVSMVESTGVFMALGKICDKDIESQDLTNGYRAEGIAIILGAIFNSFPYTTYSQNVGLVQLSNVKTTKVIAVAGSILVIFGFIPKLGTLATLIPTSVLGGAMIAMFGMVMVYGMKILSEVDLNRQENLLIIACSVGLGLGVTVVPQIFSNLPSSIQILTSNGIVTGGITAIILNIIFNILGVKSKQVSYAGNQKQVS